MLGILGFLFVAFGTYAALLTLAYRVVLTDQYAAYRAASQTAGKPYSWWRFFWVYQTNIFRKAPLEPMKLPQAVLIAFMSLTPMALIAHYLL